jgi:hypothetical protein
MEELGEEGGRWPALPYEDWRETKETLHRYTQIVGKIRMSLVPPRNHWWHVTLYLDARGLTTGPMPYEGREIEIAFDFVDHRLRVWDSDGREVSFPLSDQPACADFYARLLEALEEIDAEVEIHAEPFDLGDSPPFAEDRLNSTYDADAVHRYWRVLAATTAVLDRLRSDFPGKASPVHLFWHSFDLAHARFSGRRVDPGDVDPITREAYSHEVIAFGFWPGDEKQTPFPAFYSYTAPEPDGLTDGPLPEPGAWHTDGGTLAILPYEEMRQAGDPDALLLAFYEGAYEAGSKAADWRVE